MKKYLYFAGAALLGLASCSQEDIRPVENEGNVHLTVSLPGNQFATRAFSDGYTALDLAYAVYDADTGNFVSEGTATFPADKLSTTINLQLANGRAYNVAFFAYDKSQSVYTIDWADKKTISVDYSKMTDYNATDYDSFYKLEPIEKVTGPVEKTITLTRPLAQINWGTNDLAHPGVTAVDAYDKNAAKLVSSVTIKNVYNAFTVLDGKVAGDAVDVTFSNRARPDKTKETFPVEADAADPAYEYLSMQYVLVDAGQNTLVEATLTPARTEATAFTGTPVVVANLPVQRNFRTNIYGSLLTSPADFTIIKEPNYPTTTNLEYVPVATASALMEAVAKGGNVTLTQDVVLTEELPLAADKPVALSLNGNNLTMNFGTDVSDGKSLTIKGTGTEVIRFGSDQKGNAFNLTGNGSLSLEGVRLENSGIDGKLQTMVFFKGANNVINLKDIVIEPNTLTSYGVTTNASTPEAGNVVYMENVTVKPSAINACPTLFNIPMTLKAKNCKFYGTNQGIILRGGNYTFENCEFHMQLAVDTEGNVTTTKDDIRNGFRAQNRANWGSGNQVPLAAITMGNKGNSYQYPTVVDLKGCKVIIPEVAKNTGDIESSLPAVYIAANADAENGVTFTYDAATEINGAIEYEETNKQNISVNGNGVE